MIKYRDKDFICLIVIKKALFYTEYNYLYFLLILVWNMSDINMNS